jgi:pantoate--beta-alanine ligase
MGRKVLRKNASFELEYFQIADETSLLPCLIKIKTKSIGLL